MTSKDERQGATQPKGRVSSSQAPICRKENSVGDEEKKYPPMSGQAFLLVGVREGLGNGGKGAGGRRDRFQYVCEEGEKGNKVGP